MNDLQILRKLIDKAGSTQNLSYVSGVEAYKINAMLSGNLKITTSFLSGCATALNMILTVKMELKDAPKLF